MVRLSLDKRLLAAPLPGSMDVTLNGNVLFWSSLTGIQSSISLPGMISNSPSQLSLSSISRPLISLNFSKTETGSGFFPRLQEVS